MFLGKKYFSVFSLTFILESGSFGFEDYSKPGTSGISNVNSLFPSPSSGAQAPPSTPLDSSPSSYNKPSIPAFPTPAPRQQPSPPKQQPVVQDWQPPPNPG